ncbi:MAG: AAA family ATPase [Halobacteriovoraceae bacterium]|nr:AAA family ATPase [Halobacteriovoraceae bacterium]
MKNFRSLSNVQIRDFEDINMVYGVNNSGKSNFLKFLELVFQRKEKKNQVIFQEDGQEVTRVEIEKTNFWEGYIYDMPFLFTNNQKEKDIEFSVSLLINPDELGEYGDILLKEGFLEEAGGGHRNYIEFVGKIMSLNEFDSEIKLESVKIKDVIAYSINEFDVPQYFAENEELVEKIGSDGVLEIISIFNDCILLVDSNRYFRKEKDSSEYSPSLQPKNFKNWLFHNFLNAEKYQYFLNLNDFLNNISLSKNLKNKFEEELKNFPFEQIEISFAKFDSELEIMLKTSYGRYPLKNYGTGIQQMLYLYTKVFESTSRIFLIEEIELNLSKIYQEVLINNFRKFIEDQFLDQLIFTSHSDQFKRNDFRHFNVTIDTQGVTSIRKIENPRTFFDKMSERFE